MLQEKLMGDVSALVGGKYLSEVRRKLSLCKELALQHLGESKHAP